MDHEDELQRQTEPRFDLVPPGRRPPTAIGAATPQPPELPRSRVRWQRSALVRFLAEATNEYIDILVKGLGRLVRAGQPS